MSLKDEQGMIAMGVALMLIVVLSLFGTVLWQYSMAEMKRLQKTEDDLQALFLARAGAEAAMLGWKEEANPDNKPFGTFDPVYYDLGSKKFTVDKPAKYLGQVVVEIREEDATEDGKDKITVIEAVGTVGSSNRKVRLVTYPHRYGHEDPLLWYSRSNGLILKSTYKPLNELIVMRTEPDTKPIYIGRSSSNIPGSAWTSPVEYKASHIVFDSPMNLGLDGSNLWNSPSGERQIIIAAEKIFFTKLEVSFLDKGSFVFDYYGKNYQVKLELPSFPNKSGVMTKLGYKGEYIRDKIDPTDVVIEDEDLFGEVYFDNLTFALYEYYKPNFITVAVRSKDHKELKNKGYYFKEGTILDAEKVFGKNGKGLAYLKEHLIPIKSDHQTKREELEGLQPFFWEL